MGIRFNEGDIKRVDSQIQKLQSQLKALSTNIRVKVDPIVQTAGKGIDQVGKKVTSSIDPRVAELMSKDEQKLTRAISNMEKSIREGRVSKDSQPKVLAKLAATLYQLESTLRRQGKVAQAGKVRTKAERTSERATKYSIKQEQAQIKAAEKAAIAESKAAEKARVAQAKAEALRRKPMEDQSRAAKTRFGQKQGSARNVLQEIGLSSQVATSKLNTALVNIQAMNRDAKKFDDTAFKLEGFRNALSSVNKETARQVKGITQSGRSQEDQLKQLQAISSKVEENLKRAFSTAQRAGLPRVGARAAQDMLQGKQTGIQSLRAASMSPMKLEDQIATLETRSGARGGFKSIKEQEDLIQAIETRKRQAFIETANLANRLTSKDVAVRKSAADTIKQINRDITRVSAIENRARARQVMDTNRQIENSFRMMAKRAFTSMNNIRIIATTATGAMASFAGITPFIQDNRTLEQLNSAFIAITGNAKDAKMMMDFVNKSSDTLGLSFKDVAEASKSFSAATQAQGVSLAETQEMLTGVFQASRVLGLSSEDTQGAIRAMSQMFGKVNVSAEELRQQLGERIPNAIPLAAKAMYGTTEATDKLFAAMQRGELKAKDLLPKLTKEFANFAEAGLPSATKSIGAEIERFKNSMFGLFTGIGEAGALAGVTQVIRVMADVIQGLTPILSKLIGTFSYFARVLLTPLELLAKALKLITKIDDAIGFLIGRIGKLTGASKGVTEFAQSLLSLSTILSLAVVAPIFTRFGAALKTVLMWLPSVRAMSGALGGFTTAAMKGSRAAGILAGAFAFLGKAIKTTAITALALVRKFALPFLALAVVIEDLTAVTNDNKDSLLKWALNAKGAMADFVRGPLGMLAAGILMIDQLFASFFGADLKTDRLRGQVEDIFKIKIDPKATIDEIWDAFWGEITRKTSGEEGMMDKMLGLDNTNGIASFFKNVFTFYKGFLSAITALPRHILTSMMSEDFFGTLVQPFKDAWSWISNLFTTRLPEAIKSAASLMLAALEAKFIKPFQKKWNWLADKVPGMGKIELSGEAGSRKEAGLAKNDPVMSSQPVLPKPIPIPRKEAGLDKAMSRMTNPIMNMTVNQTVNAAPGMDEQAVANLTSRQLEMDLHKMYSSTVANSPRTE